jgi:hypothetical protein
VVDKRCHCAKSKKEMLCLKDFKCEAKCPALKDCGRHACKRKCCKGTDCPQCQEVCNRRLLCSHHKCEARCHAGYVARIRGPCVLFRVWCWTVCVVSCVVFEDSIGTHTSLLEVSKRMLIQPHVSLGVGRADTSLSYLSSLALVHGIPTLKAMLPLSVDQTRQLRVRPDDQDGAMRARTHCPPSQMLSPMQEEITVPHPSETTAAQLPLRTMPPLQLAVRTDDELRAHMRSALSRRFAVSTVHPSNASGLQRVAHDPLQALPQVGAVRVQQQVRSAAWVHAAPLHQTLPHASRRSSRNPVGGSGSRSQARARARC